MSDFWAGFLLAFLILAPVRVVLGYYQVAVWDKDGFRWVLKWKRFDEEGEA